MALIRIVVVDDETTFAQAIADSLAMEEDIKVIGVVSNGKDAVQLVCDSLPDVVLLDLNMPGMGGLEALRRIKERTPSTEVVILTVQADDTCLFTALKAGAKGYLLKNASLEEVATGVREVALGRAAIPPALATRVLEEFQRLTSQGPSMQRLFSLLTRQEAEVLKQIGVGRSNKQIGSALSVELTTVKKHITNIRQKLEVNSRMEAALIARDSGLTDMLSIEEMASSNQNRWNKERR